jgi:hypothetical protein
LASPRQRHDQAPEILIDVSTARRRRHALVVAARSGIELVDKRCGV